MLLEAGAGAVVNDTGGSGWTALAQAARSGHLECFHSLLAAGADINLRVQNGSLDDTPLETLKWDRYEMEASLPCPPPRRRGDPAQRRPPVHSEGGCGRRVRGLRARTGCASRRF